MRLTGAALAIAVTGALGAATTASAEQSASQTRIAALEAAVAREVNAVRVAQGLRPLKASPGLTRAAANQSRTMLDGGFFAHESPSGLSFSDRIKRFYPPRGRWTVGENLAMFGGIAPTARAVVRAWLDSPPHRENLLAPDFRELGLGVMFTQAGGGVYAGTPSWVITLDLGARD